MHQVRDGVFLDDPIHPANRHICQPKPVADIIAEQQHRKARSDVKLKGTAPRKAYTQLRASVSADFGHDAAERDSVMRVYFIHNL